MKKRLAFAKKYINMPKSFWKKIMWSDESKFESQQLEKKDCVRKKIHETYKKPFITPAVKFGGGSRGCFFHGMELVVWYKLKE